MLQRIQMIFTREKVLDSLLAITHSSFAKCMKFWASLLLSTFCSIALPMINRNVYCSSNLIADFLAAEIRVLCLL